MNASEQIKRVLVELGMKITQFCNAINVDRHVVADIYYGRVAKISPKLASAISEVYPQFNIAWLVTGKGEMLLPQNSVTINSNSNKNVFDILGDTINSGAKSRNYINKGANQEIIESLKLQNELLLKQIDELKQDKEHLKNIIDKLLSTK